MQFKELDRWVNAIELVACHVRQEAVMFLSPSIVDGCDKPVSGMGGAIIGGQLLHRPVM